MKQFKALLRILNHPLNKEHRIRAFIRIIFWKFNQLLFGFPVTIRITPDVKCLCYPWSSYGGLVVYTKLPDYWEQKFLLNTIKGDSVFVDIGANIGVYSLLAAAKVTSGKVFSFEVLELPLKNLKENVAINNFGDRVEIVQMLASDKNGYEYFAEEKESEVSHIAYNGDQVEGTKYPSVCLDSFLSKRSITRIDVIKVDVEGAELKVLRGLEKLFRKKAISALILEVNKNITKYGASPQDVFLFLTGVGYASYQFDVKGKLKKAPRKLFSSKKTNNFVFLPNPKTN